MRTSKSPERVLVEALKVAEASLPAYAHRFSPKKFTLHQLFACLVLKDFYGLAYHGATGLLADSDSLAKAIGLKTIPHWTTLQKAADRLLPSRSFLRLLSTTVEHAKRAKIVRGRVRLAAVDTSGFKARHTSRYYAWRRKKAGKHGRKCAVSYRRFPKLGADAGFDSEANHELARDEPGIQSLIRRSTVARRPRSRRAAIESR